jgi:hypothetical protein
MSLLEASATPTPDTGATPPPAGGTEGKPSAATPPVASTDWFYDENLKGSGDKPEWLKDKYKTAADQAKAYNDLEKKLGAFKGAPDEYDLTIEGTDVKFSKDDPMLQEFLVNAKENGVSQEYITHLLGTYAQALTAHIPNAEAELQKIGVNHKQDLQILSQWAGQQLTPEEYSIFNKMVTTADAFKVFDKLRQSTTRADVPASQGKAAHETVEQVTASISDPRYDTDPQFRDDVRRRMSVAMGHGRK